MKKAPGLYRNILVTFLQCLCLLCTLSIKRLHQAKLALGLKTHAAVLLLVKAMSIMYVLALTLGINPGLTITFSTNIGIFMQIKV